MCLSCAPKQVSAKACLYKVQGIHALVHAGARRNPHKKLAMVVAVMAFAGFTAGLLGIGGALIFNPVLLQLGVQPQVRDSKHNLAFLQQS